MDKFKAWLSRHRTSIAVFGVIIFLISVFVYNVTSHDIDPWQLKTLEAEPISKLVPPGTKVYSEKHQEAQKCGIWEMCEIAGGSTTSEATIDRVFKPTSSNNQAALRFLCDQARKQGWAKERDYWAEDKTSCGGSKKVKGQTIGLVISINSDYIVEHPPAVYNPDRQPAYPVLYLSWG